MAGVLPPTVIIVKEAIYLFFWHYCPLLNFCNARSARFTFFCCSASRRCCSTLGSKFAGFLPAADRTSHIVCFEYCPAASAFDQKVISCGVIVRSSRLAPSSTLPPVVAAGMRY